VIPLRDDQPTQSFPILTILLIAANVLVYIRQCFDPSFTHLYSLIPAALTHNDDIGYHQWLGQHLDYSAADGQDGLPVPPRPLWVTLFSCMFLHASLLHIGGNMLFLWIFGNNIEDALGKIKFTVFYFACGLAASLAMVVTQPNSAIPTLGASGAWSLLFALSASQGSGDYPSLLARVPGRSAGLLGAWFVDGDQCLFQLWQPNRRRCGLYRARCRIFEWYDTHWYFWRTQAGRKAAAARSEFVLSVNRMISL